MTDKKKIETFQYELSLIYSVDIKEFVKFAIGILPDYFFTIPASSSGKYHPEYALGDGGLVRHTKAAVRIASALYGCDTATGKFTRRQKDMMLAALLIHDGCKCGMPKKKHTQTNHPEVVCEHVENHCEAHRGIELPKSDREVIYSLVKSHMGQWNQDPKTGEVVLKKPESPGQRFVHMVDYLASRKLININFEE